MKLTIAIEIDGVPDDTDLSAGSAPWTAEAAAAAVSVIKTAEPDRFDAGDVTVRFTPEFEVPGAMLVPPSS